MRQFLQQSLPTLGNSLYLLYSLHSYHLGYHLKLLFRTFPFHEGFSQEYLCKYTSHTPYINCCGILITAEQEFRCPVPSGGNIVSQFIAFRFMSQGTSKAEIAYFKITIFINQQIPWFLSVIKIRTKSLCTTPAE